MIAEPIHWNGVDGAIKGGGNRRNAREANEDRRKRDTEDPEQGSTRVMDDLAMSAEKGPSPAPFRRHPIVVVLAARCDRAIAVSRSSARPSSSRVSCNSRASSHRLSLRAQLRADPYPAIS
jgi:hypothetical protein